MHDIVYQFRPVLGIGDWFALMTPLTLGVLVILLTCLLGRSRKRRGLPYRALGVAGSVMSCAFLAVAYMHLPRLTTVTFQGQEMRMSLIIGEKRLPLAPPNEIRLRNGMIELHTPHGYVVLPTNGEWKAGDLLVDANYLAKEFDGRSYRFRTGSLALH